MEYQFRKRPAENDILHLLRYVCRQRRSWFDFDTFLCWKRGGHRLPAGYLRPIYFVSGKNRKYQFCQKWPCHIDLPGCRLSQRNNRHSYFFWHGKHSVNCSFNFLNPPDYQPTNCFQRLEGDKAICLSVAGNPWPFCYVNISVRAATMWTEVFKNIAICLLKHLQKKLRKHLNKLTGNFLFSFSFF